MRKLDGLSHLRTTVQRKQYCVRIPTRCTIMPSRWTEKQTFEARFKDNFSVKKKKLSRASSSAQ